MGDRGRQLPHRRDAIGMRKCYLSLAQGFRGKHMLGEVAANHERGLHPLRVRLQGRIGHCEVAPAKSKVEPPFIADFLSGEAPVVIRLGRPLKSVRSQEVSYVLADKLLRRHSPSPLEGRICTLPPVIASNDGYAIGGPLEHLSSQVFSPF